MLLNFVFYILCKINTKNAATEIVTALWNEMELNGTKKELKRTLVRNFSELLR